MNKPTDDDFFGDEAGASINHKELKQKVDEALKLASEIADAEAVLATQKNRLNKLKCHELPTLMEELGTDIYRDPATGQTVELELAVNASLPKDAAKRNAIMDALRPLGVETIMTEEYTVAFSPGDIRSAIIRRLLLPSETSLIESNEILDRVEELREELGIGDDLPAELKTGVHPSRFKAWLKNLIREGQGTEVREAGIWHGQQAAIKMPKKKV